MDIQPSINNDKQSVKRVKHSRVLGVQTDEHLDWSKHIGYIAGKILSGIGAIKKAREFVDQSTSVLIYNEFRNKSGLSLLARNQFVGLTLKNAEHK